MEIIVDPDAGEKAAEACIPWLDDYLGPKIADRARIYCPVDTGALRDSIAKSMDGTTLVVSAVGGAGGREYAAYLELGHRVFHPFTHVTGPEWAVARPFLRPALILALCGAAIGFLAAGAAVAYDPQAGIGLVNGMLPVARNLLGFTGVALLLSLAIGGLLSWIGPLAYVGICQCAAIANYSEPLTWAARPPADRGGWVAALVVFAVGLIAFTIRGPRIRPSGE